MGILGGKKKKKKVMNVWRWETNGNNSVAIVGISATWFSSLQLFSVLEGAEQW